MTRYNAIGIVLLLIVAICVTIYLSLQETKDRREMKTLFQLFGS